MDVLLATAEFGFTNKGPRDVRCRWRPAGTQRQAKNHEFPETYSCGYSSFCRTPHQRLAAMKQIAAGPRRAPEQHNRMAALCVDFRLRSLVLRRKSTIIG